MACCDIKIPHDIHCFLCSAPILIEYSREAYIHSDGQSATFCQLPHCQSYADCRDKEFGVPIVELERRLNGGKRR